MPTTGTRHEQSGINPPSVGKAAGVPRNSEAFQIKRAMDFLTSQYVTQPTNQMLPPQEALARAL
ncbi:MAG: hypothetical protein V4793_13560 [Paraburkholderia tropica]|uniref:hypothetical protein n=1 Tax=Paraburkholderia tropica TaxID=92647 RepID=UPI003100C5F8